MSSLRVHYFQHAPFEGLGCIETWIQNQHHPLTCTRWYEGDPLPAPEDIDMLIIMGGPMGVYETEKYPWLQAEKKFIRKAIENNKKVLGICLGAQLIAAAMGAKVYPNREKEIGWFPVHPTALDYSGDLIHQILKSSPMVFHWHGDTFDLPPGAVNHAYTTTCCHQLFSLGKNVLGVQFHFEATGETIRQMLQHGEEELSPAKYIQSKEAILKNIPHTLQGNSTMHALLNALAAW